MSNMLSSIIPLITKHWRISLVLLSPIIIPICSLMLLLASPPHCAVITHVLAVPLATFVTYQHDDHAATIPYHILLLSCIHASFVWIYIHRHIYTTYHRHVVITSSCVALLSYITYEWIWYHSIMSHTWSMAHITSAIATLLTLCSEYWVPSTRHHLHVVESRLIADCTIRHRIHHHYVAHMASLYVEPANGKEDRSPPFTPKSVSRFLLNVNASHITSAALARGTEKPVLVLLSGYGAGCAMWINNLEELSHYFRIHCVDLLGNGMSKRIPLPRYSVEAVENYFIDALDRWREETGIEKMILCGHSFGGYMAVCYAIRYPQRVQRLILASPVGVPEAPPPDNPLYRRGPPFGATIVGFLHAAWRRHYTVSMALKFLGPLGYIITRRIVARRFGGIAGWDTSHLGDYIYHLAAGPATGHGALPVILLPGAWAHNPLVHRVHQLKCPTFFMYGAYDWMEEWAGVACVGKIRKNGIPSDCVVIPKSGHQLFMENVPAFNKRLIEFALGDNPRWTYTDDMEDVDGEQIKHMHQRKAKAKSAHTF